MHGNYKMKSAQNRCQPSKQKAIRSTLMKEGQIYVPLFIYYSILVPAFQKYLQHAGIMQSLSF